MLARLLSSADPGAELHLAAGMLTVLVFLGLAVFAVVVKGAPFDMQAFGIGIGGVFTGVGLAGACVGLQRRAQGDDHA